MSKAMIAYLNFGGHLSPVVVRRNPRYLRFVLPAEDFQRSILKRLDALDQVTDEPASDDYIIAAALVHSGSKSTSAWKNVVYAPVENQPSQEVLRHSRRWQDWVLSQAGQSSVAES